MLLLSSCEEPVKASPAPVEKSERVKQVADVEPHCQNRDFYLVEGERYESIPWDRSLFDYKEDRFKTKRERKEHQARTRELIESAVKRLGGSAKQARLFVLIAERESSLIGSQKPLDGMGVTHRLDADQESSYKSWVSNRSRLQPNRYARQSDVWKTYGLYGTNSVYGARFFDPNEDPRVLGDSVASTIAQVARTKAVAQKLGRSIPCPVYEDSGEKYVNATGKNSVRGVYRRDKEGQVIRDSVYVPRTWYTIHRGVQSGSVCPAYEHSTVHNWLRGAFEVRAKRFGLDPHR